MAVEGEGVWDEVIGVDEGGVEPGGSDVGGD